MEVEIQYEHEHQYEHSRLSWLAKHDWVIRNYKIITDLENI